MVHLNDGDEMTGTTTTTTSAEGKCGEVGVDDPAQPTMSLGARPGLVGGEKQKEPGIDNPLLEAALRTRDGESGPVEYGPMNQSKHPTTASDS